MNMEQTLYLWMDTRDHYNTAWKGRDVVTVCRGGGKKHEPEEHLLFSEEVVPELSRKE